MAPGLIERYVLWEARRVACGETSPAALPNQLDRARRPVFASPHARPRCEPSAPSGDFPGASWPAQAPRYALFGHIAGRLVRLSPDVTTHVVHAAPWGESSIPAVSMCSGMASRAFPRVRVLIEESVFRRTRPSPRPHGGLGHKAEDQAMPNRIDPY